MAESSIGAPGYSGRDRLNLYIGPISVELVLGALLPIVQPTSIDHYLSGWIEFNMSTVHRSGCRTFEVDALAVIPASVARTLEFTLARFPIRRTTEMCTAGINDEEPFGIADHPHAIVLLKFGIDTKPKVCRVSDPKNFAGFEKGSRQEEPQKHQEVGSKEATNGGPNDAATHLIDGIGRRFTGYRLGFGSRRSADGSRRCFGWFVCSR